MGKSPPRQHYVSKCLMKQWEGDDGRVGVICLLHRWSGTVSAKALNWHKNLTSEPEKTEKEWAQAIENPGSSALQKIADASQVSNSGYIDAIRDAVEVSETLEALINLVALHASRSIMAPMKGFWMNDWLSPPDPSVTLDDIKKRQKILSVKYHNQGITLRVYDTPAPVLLSQLPVYDSDDWPDVDDPMLGAAQTFQMPLTPRIILYGDPTKPPGTVSVESALTDGKAQRPQNRLEWWPAGNVRRLIASPLVICSVEQADRLGTRVLRLTAGSTWHWLGMHNRMRGNDQPGVIDDSIYNDITIRCRRYDKRLRKLPQALTGNPNSRILLRRFNRWVARELRVCETKLSDVLAEVESPSKCSCNYFYKNGDIAFWRTLIPEVVCQQANKA